MLRYSAVVPVLLAGISATTLPSAVRAQSAPQQLNETQQTGRAIFAQSCGVCHLPPVINAHTYGPALSKDTAGGNDDVIRIVIADGTPRMPGFKHYLGQPQIDAIIAYLKTVPAPSPASPAPAR